MPTTIAVQRTVITVSYAVGHTANFIVSLGAAVITRQGVTTPSVSVHLSYGHYVHLLNGYQTWLSTCGRSSGLMKTMPSSGEFPSDVVNLLGSGKFRVCVVPRVWNRLDGNLSSLYWRVDEL